MSKVANKQDAHSVGVCTVYCSKKMNKNIMIPVSVDKDLNLFRTVLLIMKLVDRYEMDKTSIFMFEILEPGGSALGKYSI